MKKTAAVVAVVLALGAVFTVSAERTFWVGAGLSGAFVTDLGAGPLGMENSGSDWSETTPWLGGGFNIFYDFLYGFADVGIGMTFADVTPTIKVGDRKTEDDNSVAITTLNFSLMGKVPIDLGADGWVLYPMIGAEYALCLSYDIEGEKNSKPGELSQFWVNGGIGMEIPLPSNLYILDDVYLRFEALYGFGLPSQASVDAADAAGSGWETLPSHRLNIRLGIGFKF